MSAVARLFLIAGLFWGVAGCATHEAVNSGAAMMVGSDVSVDPQTSWAKVLRMPTSGTLWTIDGVGLNELYFFTDIRPGDPLVTVKGERGNDTRVYSDKMLPNDVMDLLASTVEKIGYRQVRTSGLAPFPFGAGTGFSFNLDFTTANDLQMKGTALAAQRSGKLDLILFAAPAEYYFGRYEPTVEKIFASVSAPGT